MNPLITQSTLYNTILHHTSSDFTSLDIAALDILNNHWIWHLLRLPSPLITQSTLCRTVHRITELNWTLLSQNNRTTLLGSISLKWSKTITGNMFSTNMNPLITYSALCATLQYRNSESGTWHDTTRNQ